MYRLASAIGVVAQPTHATWIGCQRSLRPHWAEVTKVGRGHRNVGRGHLVRDGRGPRLPVPNYIALLVIYQHSGKYRHKKPP